MRSIWRLIQTLRVLLHYQLDELIPARYRGLRLCCRLIGGWRRKNVAPLGVRIREALQALGPIQVKFGQVLSTRRDLLPDPIANELVKLQDQVPPFPNEQAQQQIEQALQAPITTLFANFSSSPLASASIAQVHAATLPDGTEVIVKVVRPGIANTIERDMQLILLIARLAQKFIPDTRRLRLTEVVQDYDKTIHDELDLMREAANCALLRRNFTDSDLLYVPQIYWDYTCETVMVQERIYGTPVDQIDNLRAQGVDVPQLAERGVEIFFTQVFRDNFFHADMHPGNIFVGADGRYLGVDFGIMGTLTRTDQRYLAENLLAFFHRDYYKIAELHVTSGWVPEGTRITEFEAAIRTVSEPIWQRPISEISFGQFLLRLFQTARRFRMEIQPQLVLLQKTLLNIEGLGRQLYPDLDLWQTAKPFLERWLADQVGPRAFAQRLRDSLPILSETLPELPQLAYQALQQASQQAQHLQTQQAALQHHQQQLIQHQRHQRRILIGGILLLGSILLYSLFRN
ncbi:MAG: ubiquinone biosynthesis regulatory protein kinase UbiB [Pseudomonadota bacterium]